MQSCNEEFREYSNSLDTDFSNWKKDIFRENTQFSDIENNLCSKNRNMQSMDIFNQKTIFPTTRSNMQEYSDSEYFQCPIKKRKISELHTVSIFSHVEKESTPKSSPKSPFENSTTLVNRIRLGKSKQSDEITISGHKTSSSQILNVSNQRSNDSKITSYKVTSIEEMNSNQEYSDTHKMIFSSQESSEKMSISSQESSGSHKITTCKENSTSKIFNISNQETFTISQKMVTSSQESSATRNISSSQEFYTSPKRIASSQESLGKKVMNISIEEDSTTFNAANQTSQIPNDITPQKKRSTCQCNFNHEDNSSRSSVLKQVKVNSKKLKLYNQQNLANCTVSNKRIQSDFSDKNNFAISLKNSACDFSYNKICRPYNNVEKSKIWKIRKREMEVTKRENAVESFKKLLDAKEANIQKREELLKAKERRYLRYKANMKTYLKKLTTNSKQSLDRLNVLQDETTAFNRMHVFKVLK